MKHTSFLIKTALAATLLCNLPLGARADDQDPAAAPAPGGPGHGGPGNGFGRDWGKAGAEMRERFEAFKNLNLTDDQKKQIRDIMQEAKPAMEPLLKSFGAQHAALSKLTEATPLNEAAIRDAAAKLGSTEGDMAMAKAKVSERIRAVLTPEQVKQYNDAMAGLGAALGGPGFGGPRGPGHDKGHGDQNGKGVEKEGADD